MTLTSIDRLRSLIGEQPVPQPYGQWVAGVIEDHDKDGCASALDLAELLAHALAMIDQQRGSVVNYCL